MTPDRFRGPDGTDGGGLLGPAGGDGDKRGMTSDEGRTYDKGTAAGPRDSGDRGPRGARPRRDAPELRRGELRLVPARRGHGRGRRLGLAVSEPVDLHAGRQRPIRRPARPGNRRQARLRLVDLEGTAGHAAEVGHPVGVRDARRREQRARPVLRLRPGERHQGRERQRRLLVPPGRRGAGVRRLVRPRQAPARRPLRRGGDRLGRPRREHRGLQVEPERAEEPRAADVRLVRRVRGRLARLADRLRDREQLVLDRRRLARQHRKPVLLRGGINVSKLFDGAPPCFSSFLSNTRSSFSVDAAGQDVVGGQINTCGRIKISKTTAPAQSPSFGFATTGAAPVTGFQLAGGESKEFTEVKPGAYTVSEMTPPQDWALDSLSCPTTSGRARPRRSRAARCRSTSASSGTCECTYVNKRKPQVKLVKDFEGTGTPVDLKLGDAVKGTSPPTATPASSPSTRARTPRARSFSSRTAASTRPRRSA